MRKTGFFFGSLLLASLIFSGTAAPAEKVGNLDVRSPLFGTRVYVDDEYKGDADIFIDDVPAGEHFVTCRHAGHTVSGKFMVREKETLVLEVRFDEGKIVSAAEAEKIEAGKKKAEEEAPPAEATVKEEPQKKKVAAPEKKKEERPGKAQDKFKLHLNIIKVAIDDARPEGFSMSRRTNPKVIRDYTEKKKQNGKLYRNKQNVLMCENGLCTREWTTSFIYIDDAGKSDSFRLTWRKTTNWYKTPEGVSRGQLEWCVNDKCADLAVGDDETAQKSDLGRYSLNWTKNSINIRRSDIAKEITALGGNVADY